MIKKPARYWVGMKEDSRGSWLFDSDLVHEDQRMIYLFNVSKQYMNEYSRLFARKVLTEAADLHRIAAIPIYEKWYAYYGENFLVLDEVRRRGQMLNRDMQDEADALREHLESLQREADMVARRQEAITRHRNYLETLGKAYLGVAENLHRRHRVTHCYRCRHPLESDLHVECRLCSWLICYCGACGCGFTR